MSQNEEGGGEHDDEPRSHPAPLQEERDLFDANDGEQERDHYEAYRGEQEGALHDAFYEGDDDEEGDLHADYEGEGDDSQTRLRSPAGLSLIFETINEEASQGSGRTRRRGLSSDGASKSPFGFKLPPGHSANAGFREKESGAKRYTKGGLEVKQYDWDVWKAFTRSQQTELMKARKDGATTYTRKELDGLKTKSIVPNREADWSKKGVHIVNGVPWGTCEHCGPSFNLSHTTRQHAH